MDETAINPKYLSFLMSFDYLQCPHCEDGIFSEDHEDVEKLIILGLPRLLCLCCGQEYDLSFYLGDNDNE